MGRDDCVCFRAPTARSLSQLLCLRTQDHRELSIVPWKTVQLWMRTVKVFGSVVLSVGKWCRCTEDSLVLVSIPSTVVHVPKESPRRTSQGWRRSVLLQHRITSLLPRKQPRTTSDQSTFEDSNTTRPRFCLCHGYGTLILALHNGQSLDEVAASRA